MFIGKPSSLIVPEYSFLDARGLGAFEGKTSDVIAQVYEADNISPNIRPPPIDDGTPNRVFQTFLFVHNDLFFSPGEVREVDPDEIPAYKQPASGASKCSNPPSCN
ncbi:hypothetical protein MKX01_039027 [Papaver californicum]|nr:hypothetical protein MKX01_039027 [Papaver californicum]